jgi:hypothetical protein
MRAVSAPQYVEKLKASFGEIALSEEQWDNFSLMFKGDVDEILSTRSDAISQEIRMRVEGGGVSIDTGTSNPDEWPQSLLSVERDKAKEQVGLDAQRQLRYTQLQALVTSEEKIQEKAVAELAHAEGAGARRSSFLERRRQQYVKVFQCFLDEMRILEDLYSPLQSSLMGATGSLMRLRLSVSREIDIRKWINAGEELLDLRKDSGLRGHGALEKHVNQLLTPAWRSGTAESVGEAMQTFIKEMLPEIKKAMPSTILPDNHHEWLQNVAAWLYSTNHIEMRYSITYDNVAIEQLSPGTRGIVLLLLYLVIDRHDRRPLIIDQPEENLDPKSVFDELVPHFRDARKRRQIIIVTHNANLVINTDADQVIVASATPKPLGGLPSVNYRCGAIENPAIRTLVCEILEGGKQAFLDRERRYRLSLDADRGPVRGD